MRSSLKLDILYKNQYRASQVSGKAKWYGIRGAGIGVFYKNGGKNCVTIFGALGGHGIRGSGMGGAFTVYRRLVVL